MGGTVYWQRDLLTIADEVSVLVPAECVLEAQCVGAPSLPVRASCLSYGWDSPWPVEVL